VHTEHLMVTGMTCGSCTSKVSRAISAVAGVDEVKVSLADGNATVRFNEHQTSIEQVKSAVMNAGYGVDRTAPSKDGCCS
jgi:copper chaperone